MQTYGVADQTARKAVSVLREEGLVHNVSGKVLTVLKRIAKSLEEISDTLWQVRQKSEQPQ